MVSYLELEEAITTMATHVYLRATEAWVKVVLTVVTSGLVYQDVAAFVSVELLGPGHTSSVPPCHDESVCVVGCGVKGGVYVLSVACVVPVSTRRKFSTLTSLPR